MTNSQSKIFKSVPMTCKDFVHPWSNNCVDNVGSTLLAATPYCLRVYTVLYGLSLISRGLKIKSNDVKRSILGILQSTAFLVTNAYGFMLFHCLIRNLLGCYYHGTVAFAPAFFASLMAISIERPARRPMLTFYVANVATETLWNMAKARGLVRSIPYGETLIFGISISILLYLFKLGLHQSTCKDGIFKIVRIFVGKTEEGSIEKPKPPRIRSQSRPPLNFRTIVGLVEVYTRFIEAFKIKHETCQHKSACLNYAIIGGLKPLLGGVSIQMGLKLIMNSRKLLKGQMSWRKIILDKNLLSVGYFLGGFSFLYKAVSCLLRHNFENDDPIFALPAGLLASSAFIFYPNKTVALYVMWKMLQLVYNLGLQHKIVPHIPGFIIFFYSFCTAVLFHGGVMEPKTLRPSYFKFLAAISGGRSVYLNFEPFDVFGQNVNKNAKEVVEKLKMSNYLKLPKYAYSTSI